MIPGNGRHFERCVVCLIYTICGADHAPYFQNFTLVLISSAATIAGFATNIQNRSSPVTVLVNLLWLKLTYSFLLMYAAAVQEMHDSLGTTSEQFSLSISVFILLQGAMPLAWTAISEVKGRKVSRAKSILDLTIISCLVGGVSCLIGHVHCVVCGCRTKP